MCDIVIVVARSEPVVLGEVEELDKLLEHVLKEPDGWGILLVDENGELVVAKTLKKKRAEQLFGEAKKIRVWFAAFHGRTKSRGEKSVLNTHPLRYRWGGKEHFLMHNGTTSMPTIERLSDSALLLRAVTALAAEKGEKTALEMLKDSSGFFVWLNGFTGRIWLVDKYGGRDGDYAAKKTDSYYVISKHFDEGIRFDTAMITPGKEIVMSGVRHMKKKRRSIAFSYYSDYVPLTYLATVLKGYADDTYSALFLRKTIKNFFRTSSPMYWYKQGLDEVKRGLKAAKIRAEKLEDVETMRYLNLLETYIVNKILPVGAEELIRQEEKEEKRDEAKQEASFEEKLRACLSDMGPDKKACRLLVDDICSTDGDVLRSVCAGCSWEEGGPSLVLRALLRAAVLRCAEQNKLAYSLLLLYEYISVCDVGSWLEAATYIVEEVDNEELRKRLLDKIHDLVDIVVHSGAPRSLGIGYYVCMLLMSVANRLGDEDLRKKVLLIQGMLE